MAKYEFPGIIAKASEMRCNLEAWAFNDRISYGNRSFQKIIDFYLFHNPVEGQTVRGVLFKDFGWADASFHTLKALMMDAASDQLSQRYKACKTYELEGYIEQFGLSVAKPDLIESAVFLVDNDRTVMRSLYRAIRHAIAHGSFKSSSKNGVKYYHLENFDGYCKARLILREDTLIKWIDVIKAGVPHN